MFGVEKYVTCSCVTLTGIWTPTDFSTWFTHAPAATISLLHLNLPLGVWTFKAIFSCQMCFLRNVDYVFIAIVKSDKIRTESFKIFGWKIGTRLLWCCPYFWFISTSIKVLWIKGLGQTDRTFLCERTRMMYVSVVVLARYIIYSTSECLFLDQCKYNN